jgi:hypothetical protein
MACVIWGTNYNILCIFLVQLIQGTGNANFYFAMNLVYATLQVCIPTPCNSSSGFLVLTSVWHSSGATFYHHSNRLLWVQVSLSLVWDLCVLWRLWDHSWIFSQSRLISWYLIPNYKLWCSCWQTVLIVESSSTIIRYDRNLKKQSVKRSRTST